MGTRGKTIKLFLMDGNPSGAIKCTLDNWTGIVYKIPRMELDKYKDRNDLSQSGLYFLFGNSDQKDEDIVYIGQAGVRKNGNGILYRIQEHKRNPDKDYWTEAVIFTTSNNSFGSTEITYLENRFTKMASSAKRYVVKNVNEPNPGNIMEEKESELEEFIDYAKIVIGILGYKVFEPLSQTTLTATSSTEDEPQVGETFYINRNGANAKARLTSEGLVILAGSTIRKNTVPSCPDYIKKAREERKEFIDEDYVIQEDILFDTLSGASSFVLGASTNGNKEWKTEQGKTLKDIKVEIPNSPEKLNNQRTINRSNSNNREVKLRDKNKLIGKTIDISQQKHDIKGRVFVKSLKEIILLKGSKCSDIHPEYNQPPTGYRHSENSKKNIYASDRVLQSDYEFPNINQAVVSLQRGGSINIWDNTIVTIDGQTLDDWLSRN